MIDKNMFDRSSGVNTVYPAHPIVVSAFIMNHFDSLEEANKRSGSLNCPAALSSQDIPGGGGDVYMALDFLSRKIGMNKEFFTECNSRYIEVRKHDHPNTAKDGILEAEKYWPLLQELYKTKPNFFLK
jgi:hypothetical protein